MTTSPDYDGPVYVGPEQDEPELVDADEGPVPAAGEREAAMEEALRKSAIRLTSPEWEGPDDPQVFELRVADLLTALWDGDGLDEAVADLAATILADPPAVPVGVQPEPAEEGETLPGWKPLEFPNLHEVIREVTFAEMSRQSGPPVVHSDFAEGKVNPEPGDRAETWQDALNDISGPDGILDDEQILGALMPVADAEVAAAVAAVRADLAREVESALDELQGLPECWYGGYVTVRRDSVHGMLRRLAAAVRSATKEGLG